MEEVKIVDKANERNLKLLETLKKNTNRQLKVLKNADTIEVLVAFTVLNQKGNEDYLNMYSLWLQELDKTVQ
jgi:plasmid maintenance system killer protein